VRRLFGVRATVPGGGVVLTFDDGPHRDGTPAVLAALERLGRPAVFFLVGEQVQRERGLVREIVAAGHQVGLHCHRHRNLMRLTPRQVGEDLLRAHELIAHAAGAPPRWYRPPYGILTAAALPVARSLGCETILWRRHGQDWDAAATPTSIAARIVRRLRPGDVILLHDSDAYSAPGSWRRTVAALDPLAASLDAHALPVVPLLPGGTSG